jgi:hypothetical protein
MEKQITSYMMLTRQDSVALSKDVNFHLDQGWKLYGNPFVSSAGNFYQAVVR